MRYVIYCPIGLNTGGPEALHQLCDAIRKLGHEAVLLPMWIQGPPSVEYLAYDAPIIESSNLTDNDVIISPEVQTSIPKEVYDTVEGKVIVWWLSVDNCPLEVSKNFEIRNNPINESVWKSRNNRTPIRLELLRKYRATLGSKLRAIDSKLGLNLPRYRSPLDDTQKTEIEFISTPALTQSNYAFNFLSEFPQIKKLMVSDYINLEFLQKTAINDPKIVSWKKPIISYNNAKGGKFVESISKNLSEFNFIPIKKMSRYQVRTLLSRSVLYLDMGYFPGKDRLPREAILCGTPVVLANRGAVRNGNDFPLDRKFVIDVQVDNPTTASLRLKDIALFKKKTFNEQTQFLDSVLNEKKIFMYEVEFLLNNSFYR